MTRTLNINEGYFGDELTRHGFISHMEAFIKQLLTNPKEADVDDYLKLHQITAEKAIEALLKKTNKEDEESAVLIRKEHIKTGEDGKDIFQVTYKLPRKDYKKKMRNLYISLFESNIIKGCPIKEENANNLQNLSKVKKVEKVFDNLKGDIQYSFGKNGWGLSDELIKLGKEIQKLSKDNNVYMRDAAIDTSDDVYTITFDVKPIKEAYDYEHMLSSTPLPFKTSKEKVISQRYHNTTGDRFAHYVNTNDKHYTPKMFTNEDGMIEDILKMDKDSAYKERGGLNIKKNIQEMDCSGALQDGGDSFESGEYINPINSKENSVIRRQINITEEQLNYIKKYELEEATAGNIGTGGQTGIAYPCFGDAETENHKNICKDKNLEDGVRKLCENKKKIGARKKNAR